MNCLHNNSIPVLHRDFYTNNILVDKSLTLKLIDFGLSKIEDSKSMYSLVDDIEKLSPSFKAPELFNKKKYNFESEIFSL